MTYRAALALITRPDQAIERQDDGSWTLTTWGPRADDPIGFPGSVSRWEEGRGDYLGGADFRDCYDTRY